MKLALVFLAVCGLAAADFQLDLKTSIDRIRDQILVSKENPADWNRLPEVLDIALSCILGGSAFMKVVSKQVPLPVKLYVETLTPKSIAQSLKNVDWKKVTEAGQVDPVQNDELWQKLKDFMATPKFEKIHEHIWSDEEFLDLIKFLYEANYQDIYTVIKQFYTDMGRGDLPLPGDPNGKPYNHNRSPRSVKSSKYSTLFPLIEQSGPIINAECSDNILNDLLKILGILEESNIHEIAKAVLYGAQEVIGNAGMHVLLLKLGEHQKGEFFHNTLALEEMDEFLPLVQGLVLAEPGVGQLNQILKDLTGLDVANPELFKYIVDLLQYLVWGYPFPQS